MMSRATKPVIKAFIILAAVGVFSLATAYYFGISLCPVYNFVGISCPSCGMTRAWSFALQGRVEEALAYHPMFWVAIFLPFLVIKNKRVDTATLIILVMFIILWTVRMIFLFPHTEPMLINDHALIFEIFYSLDD